MTRRDRIILLARTLYDLRYEPETATGRVQRRSTVSGPVPHHKEPCPRCNGDKVVRDRYRRESACVECNATGIRVVDDYTQREVATASTTTATHEPRTIMCDRCGSKGMWRQVRCWVCDGSGKRSVERFELRGVSTEPPLLDANVDPEAALLGAIERRNKAGSYAELEAVLATLKRDYPLRVHVFVAVYVLGQREPEQCSKVVQGWLEFVLARLDEMLPDPIRVPSWAVHVERNRKARLRHGRDVDMTRRRKERDRAIRAQWNRGVDVDALAREHGLSSRQVYNIVNGRTVAA